MELRRCPRVLLAAGTVLILSGPGCDVVTIDDLKYVEHEERQFAVKGTPDVTLGTFDGSIEVHVWDQPQVKVTVEKRGANRDETAAIAVRYEQEGSHVTIDARVPNAARRFGISFHGHGHARLAV